jgi:hypothetical protein
MASDLLATMRRAVHSGDGELMVRTAQEFGFDSCLQLVGEMLLAALDRRAAGAVDLARHCVTSLRQRDWPGDDELADTLTQTIAGAPSGELVELSADLEQLADLLDTSADEGPGRLDLVTGEAWPEAAFEDDTDDTEDADDAEDIDGAAEGRWLVVWPAGSRAAYHDMAEFAGTRTDERLRAGLLIALDGRGAFGRFKRVLNDWPQDRQEWFMFSDDRRRGRARAWLADAGYRARPSRPRPGP